jgi:hypothetical protein
MPVACESFPYANRYTTFINRWALCTSYTTGTTSCWIWSLSYPEALVLHHSYRKTLNKQTVSWETSHKICKGPCLFSLTAIGLINLLLKKDDHAQTHLGAAHYSPWVLLYINTSLNPVPNAQVCYFNNVWFMF